MLPKKLKKKTQTRNGVHASMTVTVWGLGSGQPKLYSQAKISTIAAAHPATKITPPIITPTAQGLAWIVSCDRTVQVFRFATEGVSFPGYKSFRNEQSVLHSQVSQDGLSTWYRPHCGLEGPSRGHQFAAISARRFQS